jgi:hypothetical protein
LYAKSHPALAIRNLKNLDLAVFNALAGSGIFSPTQSAISTKLGKEAASQSTISRTMAKLNAAKKMMSKPQRKSE